MTDYLYDNGIRQASTNKANSHGSAICHAVPWSAKHKPRGAALAYWIVIALWISCVRNGQGTILSARYTYDSLCNN
jgi:hypothetical protein